MYTQTINLDFNGLERNVNITSKDATKPFELHELDIEFIQQDIDETGALNGELQVCVKEGIITVQWQVIDIERGSITDYEEIMLNQERCQSITFKSDELKDKTITIHQGEDEIVVEKSQIKTLCAILMNLEHE